MSAPAKLRVLDLFSGIGGFSLGLERTGGFETVAFCEIEEFPRKVLAKHWPAVPQFKDVRKLRGEDVGPVDVICGGYPCQPFSTAGKRRGHEDDRHLWPEFNRLVAELRPAWVIGENVAGHISMGLDDVLSDLEGQGYACRTFVIPACAVGAPHRRDRVWTVANADDGHAQGVERERDDQKNRGDPRERPTGLRCGEGRHCEWAIEPDVGRGIDGFPAELDGDLNDAAKARATETLRRMWCDDESKEIREKLGGYDRVSEAEILLAFLCEHEARKDSGRLALDCAEARQECLRGLWRHIELARSSLQSRHNGQHAAQFADALRKLSRGAPSLYPQAWSNGLWEDDTHRLAHGIPKRVDRLKALGNAVVPQIPEMIGRAILAAESEAE